jgi:hypothetical protein
MWLLVNSCGLNLRIPIHDDVPWEAPEATRIYGVERKFQGLGIQRVRSGISHSADLNFELLAGDTFRVESPPEGWLRLAQP